jgi:hypothetical protein
VTENGHAPAPLPVDGGGQPRAAQRVAAQEVAGARVARAADRPEAPVAAAFAGGFVLAMILKRMAR